MADIKTLIWNKLDELSLKYEKDPEATVALCSVKDTIGTLLDSVTPRLLKELNCLLHLLVDAKRDSAQEQIIMLKEEVTTLTERNRQLETKVAGLETKVAGLETKIAGSEKYLAVRQIYHAVNEKLLRLIIQKSGVPEAQFWERYKVTHIGHVSKYQDLLLYWSELQQEYDFTESPKDFWDIIKNGKGTFDKFVHEGSFTHFSHKQLVDDVISSVFVGDLARYKPGFKHVLRVDKRLTDQTPDRDLYTYT